jgi:hypothetical protein
MTPETSSSAAVDWEVLSDFLLSDRTPDTCMRPAEVDGYLTGIAVSPDMIPPSDWLPVIWGGGEPEFTGIEEASRVLGLVLRHYRAPLYPSVILFDHVVFILTGAVINVRAEFVGNGLGIAGMAVGGDLLGLDLGDRSGGAEKRLGGSHIAGLAQVDVDQVAVTIDRPVESTTHRRL